MSARVQQTNEAPTEPFAGAPAPPAPAPPPPARLKHCWVTDDHGRLPALLLEWRRTVTGFQGRVVRPVYEADAWLIVEEWVDSSLLGPV